MTRGFRSSAGAPASSGGGGGRIAGRFAASTANAAAEAPFSHAQILRLMKGEFARGRRHGFAVSCVLIRPDGFAALLATHGRPLIDAVRGELAKLVNERTRTADQLGILGEDRLLLLLPHTDDRQACAVGHRLRAEFGRLEVSVGGEPVALSLSLAVATCDDRDTMFFDTMLARAEVALEWAAETGGDRVVSFNAERYVAETGEDEPSPPPALATPTPARRATDRPGAE